MRFYLQNVQLFRPAQGDIPLFAAWQAVDLAADRPRDGGSQLLHQTMLPSQSVENVALLFITVFEILEKILEKLHYNYEVLYH